MITLEDDDEANASVDGQLLSHLVGAITEVGMDEDELGSIYGSGQKSKSTKGKKVKKKNAKKSRSPNVSQ